MYREHPEYGSIASVNVNGRKYVYFYAKDFSSGKRKAIYCGVAENPRSWAKAQQTRLEYLQARLDWLTERYSKEIASINKILENVAEESRLASKIHKVRNP